MVSLKVTNFELKIGELKLITYKFYFLSCKNVFTFNLSQVISVITSLESKSVEEHHLGKLELKEEQ